MMIKNMPYIIEKYIRHVFNRTIDGASAKNKSIYNILSIQ